MVTLYVGVATYLVLFCISAIDHYFDLEIAGLCDCDGLLYCSRTHSVAAVFALLSSGVAYLVG